MIPEVYLLNIITILGGVFGFCRFLIFLESKTMGNIIFRGGEFTPVNILSYVTNPLTNTFLWYPSLWCANWIIMTGAGMGFARLIGHTVI